MVWERERETDRQIETDRQKRSILNHFLLLTNARNTGLQIIISLWKNMCKIAEPDLR